ncbi:hypothetical protein PV08_09979 [Exophiala spinifera]|uniref:Gfo/Idh/MocA-like oxidoreductase N-terminal domain-containing protein n=1 Tax=Exophiala spinifera TaxID=91928 RepID=A0A0D1YCN8_9EURO|nr:uncharacterized protein PV08_09979 [Exophiala spinifera]KIW12701.1 hypothetical protein PV08_09979 [Exophiala spinifera]
MAIGIGIIGLSASPTAWVSRGHMGALRHPRLSSKYTLKALATSSPSSATAAAETWGLPREAAYHTPDQIAADKNVDLVVIGVKLPLHRDLALPSLRAGKDVLIEWPLATNMEEIDELRQAARDGGGKVWVGLQARCSPVILKAKEIIENGILGKIISTSIVGTDSTLLYLPPKFDYEHDKKNRADISSITSGHILDALCFLLGEFEALTSTSHCFFPLIETPHHSASVPRDAPDSFMVQGVLSNGAVASLSLVLATKDTPSSISWIITGEKASLKFEGPNINIQMIPPELFLHAGAGKEWEKMEITPAFAFGQVGELYEAIADGEKTKGCLVDLEGAALRHRMLEACARSSESGTRETYTIEA